jgi:ABC-type glycerol-3-phosphate transport system permease component
MAEIARIGKRKQYIGKIVIYITLAALFVMVIYPLFWTIITSLKPEYEIYQNPVALPKKPNFEAYKTVWTLGEYNIYFRNSIIITLFSLMGILIISTAAGYGFARYRFKGSRLLFIIFTVSLVVVPASIMITQFKLIQILHLLDTYAGIILVYLSWTVFGIMLSRVAFVEIPQDIIDAARIDGCSEFKIFYRIGIPLIRPTIATIAVFHFIWIWNDFIWPLVLLQNPNRSTIMVGLLGFQGRFTTDWPTITAGLSLSVLPVLILYLIFQRFFVRGLMLGAFK